MGPFCKGLEKCRAVAWLFNDSPCKNDVVINDRWGKECRHKNGGYFTTEYTAGLDLGDHPWEESRGMGYSYGYNRAETINDYKSGKELIFVLIDMVSRGGNLLLDIGPTSDGRIPTIMEERLLEIGNWMAVNGEAIYGTRPWKTTRQWTKGKVPKVEYGHEYMVKYNVMDVVNEPHDGKAAIEAFFTQKGHDLYVIFPRWPKESSLTIKDVKTTSKTKITLLGMDGNLKFKSKINNVKVELPALTNTSKLDHNAYVLKLSNVKKN
jgi:alpha-L-fucosidase